MLHNALLCSHISSIRCIIDSVFSLLSEMSFDNWWRVQCVDCVAFAESDLRQLVSEMEGKEIILHGGEIDLQILKRYGLAAPRLFETQVAAGLTLGTKGPIGLGDLLDRRMNVAVAKGDGAKDWRPRPINRQMIEYALADVYHLHDLRETLLADMENVGRTQWFEEEMEAMWEVQEDTPDQDLWKSIRRAWKLAHDEEGLRVLQELAMWRERAARKAGLAPQLIANDNVLLSIATSKPKTEDDLAMFPGLKAGTLRFNKHEILHCMRSRAGEKSTAAPLVAPAEWTASVESEMQVLTTQRLMESLVLSRALELRLDANRLVPYGLLPEFVRADCDAERDSVIMRGWRRDVIGVDLQAIKRQEAGLGWGGPLPSMNA